MEAKIEIIKVDIGEKEILRNLIEKYEYEFSQYTNVDLNSMGLYGYDYLDYYWTEEGRYHFFIKVDNKLAGFVMVGNYMEVFKDAQYSMSEFFIIYKYRRKGIGTYVAKKVFAMFPGVWELKRHPLNHSSVVFWDRVINEVTSSKYEMINNCKQAAYEDGINAEAFKFTV